MYLKTISLCCALMLLTACVKQPEGVTALEDFDKQLYLGQWYEIARLDNRFEKGMDNVTATYALREDGGISVLNRGYAVAEKSWQEAQGKAYFVDNPERAYLKVSFFGPFYAGYTVFGLDKSHYQYAYVAGNDHSYLWLLARTPTVDDEIKQDFKRKAAAAGFNSTDLIWVNQTLPVY